MTDIVQIIMTIPLAVWVVLSIIMILEDENRGKKAKSSWEWTMKHAARWHKRVTFFVMLPLIIGLVIYCMTRNSK
jgi:hypothetical protein